MGWNLQWYHVQDLSSSVLLFVLRFNKSNLKISCSFKQDFWKQVLNEKKLLFQWVVQNKDTCTVFCSILLCILQCNIMANAHNRVLYCFIQTANNVMGGIKQITMKEQ